MGTLTTSGGLSFTVAPGDSRGLSPEDVRRFAADLTHVLGFAEHAAMRAGRLTRAFEAGTLPQGYTFPLEDVATSALVAETLEYEVARMTEWIRELRTEPSHLWHLTTTTVPDFPPADDPEREAVSAARRYLDSRDEAEEETDA